VQKLTAAGVFVAAFGSKGSGNGQLLLPVGAAVNSSGDVYVGDHSNNRIEEWESVPSAPVFVSKFGSVGSENGELKEPSAATPQARNAPTSPGRPAAPTRS
jgi:hypothetical protein